MVSWVTVVWSMIAGAALALAVIYCLAWYKHRVSWVTEAGLRESEERFRVMADTAPVMIWLAGSDARYDFFNQRWLDFRGRTREEEAGDGWTEGVHPEDASRCGGTYVQAFEGRQPFHREYRFRRCDGEYRWMKDTGVPRLEPDGTFAGYIGSCIDITDLKLAERQMREHQRMLQASHKQISDLFGRLIAVQEGERTRIARDLHDDVSQRIAGLSIMISSVKRKLRGKPDEADALLALASLQRSTVALADEIRHVSHDLHPSVLQHSGLVAALRAHCAEFGTLQAIAVSYGADADLGPLDADTSLCLYRITQEALRNVAKHADAHCVGVALSRTPDGVQLSIVDDGKGFDLVESRGKGAGLGLISIDERVRMLGGTVHIDTHPGGTRMQIQIPRALPMPLTNEALGTISGLGNVRH
jgi:PAS domain S-box-containing protein